MAAITSKEGHRFEADEKDGFLYITLHLRGKKGSKMEDLKKAQWYLNREINKL